MRYIETIDHNLKNNGFPECQNAYYTSSFLHRLVFIFNNKLVTIYLLLINYD